MSDGSTHEADDELVIERFGDGDGASGRLDPMDFAELLRSRGRKIDGFPDGLGLDRNAALEAVISLRTSGIPVLRCDIVKMAYDLPEYLCDTRHFDRTVGEPLDLHCRRSLLQLEEHVRSFSDPGDGSILYVLTLHTGNAPDRD